MIVAEYMSNIYLFCLFIFLGVSVVIVLDVNRLFVPRDEDCLKVIEEIRWGDQPVSVLPILTFN